MRAGQLCLLRGHHSRSRRTAFKLCDALLQCLDLGGIHSTGTACLTELDERHLKLNSAVDGTSHALTACLKRVQRAHDSADIGIGCNLLQRGNFVMHTMEQRGVACCLEQHQVALHEDQFLAKPLQILGCIMQLCHNPQNLRGILCRQCLQKPEQIVSSCRACRFCSDLCGDGVTECGAPVEQRNRITHTAVRQPCHQFGSVVVQRKMLLLCDIFQTGDQILLPDAAEIVPLTAGNDRRGNLVNLGCRQNEFHIRRRLLHDLEQGIERACGKHVNLVDDIDLEPASFRRISGCVAQVADILDAVVGRRIDLDEIGERTVLSRLADLTFETGIPVLARMLAVDRLCQNTGAGSLAGAAGAGEQVGMCRGLAPKLILQRRCDLRLRQDVCEGHRSPLSVKCLIHDKTSLPHKTIRNIGVQACCGT